MISRFEHDQEDLDKRDDGISPILPAVFIFAIYVIVAFLALVSWGHTK